MDLLYVQEEEFLSFTTESCLLIVAAVCRAQLNKIGSLQSAEGIEGGGGKTYTFPHERQGAFSLRTCFWTAKESRRHGSSWVYTFRDENSFPDCPPQQMTHLPASDPLTRRGWQLLGWAMRQLWERKGPKSTVRECVWYLGFTRQTQPWS